MKPVYFVIKNYALYRVGPKPSSEIDALDQSISKYLILWDEARGGTIIGDGGIDTCGLCLFHDSHCANCVIGRNNKAWSGEGGCGCDGTPYFDYVRAYNNDHVDDAELAATAELRLLRRLRRKLESEG